MAPSLIFTSHLGATGDTCPSLWVPAVRALAFLFFGFALVSSSWLTHTRGLIANWMPPDFSMSHSCFSMPFLQPALCWRLGYLSSSIINLVLQSLPLCLPESHSSTPVHSSFHQCLPCLSVNTLLPGLPVSSTKNENYSSKTPYFLKWHRGSMLGNASVVSLVSLCCVQRRGLSLLSTRAYSEPFPPLLDHAKFFPWTTYSS